MKGKKEGMKEGRRKEKKTEGMKKGSNGGNKVRKGEQEAGSSANQQQLNIWEESTRKHPLPEIVNAKMVI